MAIGRFKTINPLVYEQEKDFVMDTKILESCNEIAEADAYQLKSLYFMGTNKNGDIYLNSGGTIYQSTGRISWGEAFIFNVLNIAHLDDILSHSHSEILDFCIINNNTYFTASTGIYKYDYSNVEPIIDFDHSCVGINNKGAYIIQKNKFEIYISLPI